MNEEKKSQTAPEYIGTLIGSMIGELIQGFVWGIGFFYAYKTIKP